MTSGLAPASSNALESIEDAKKALDEFQKSAKAAEVTASGESDIFPLAVNVAKLSLSVHRDEDSKEYKIEPPTTSNDSKLAIAISTEITKRCPRHKLAEILVCFLILVCSD